MNLLLRTACFFILLIAIEPRCFSQTDTFDNVQAQKIIKRIYELQANNQKNFYSGMFPSYREYHHNKGRFKDDDNIFFTGMIVFTLRRLQPYLDLTSQSICDTIFKRASVVYKHYENTSGRPSYNFWQKDPPVIFPNSGWLNLFNKSQSLPDDLDDTAIMMLATGSNDSAAVKVHRLMQDYTNKKLKNAKASLEEYIDIPAYSTWFGEKMPVDLDVCVLANALYMVNNYRLSYTGADSASLQLICKVVTNRHYMTEGAAVSPHYNRAPVIIYHIARLMAEKNIPCLENLKPQLIRDAIACYYSSNSFLDRIILSTSLVRLGVVLPDDEFSIYTNMDTFVEDNNFVFFIANMASMLSRPINKLIGKSGIGKFYYYCPAWNEVLVLENMVWRKKFLSKDLPARKAGKSDLYN